MLSTKQMRMLKLLDSQIGQCRKCPLHVNSRCKPYWTENSKYAIIGEAPGYNEIRYNEPFIGNAGEILWNIMNSKGLHKEDFLIINSVNCRPVDEYKTWKNGKPTVEDQETCKPWIRKYLNVVEPEGILILGNYAMYTAIGNDKGIMTLNATVVDFRNIKNDAPLFNTNIPFVLSVHPALCIYRKEEGRVLLNESIEVFKKTVENQVISRKEVFDFLEDEELWKI